MLFPPLDDDIDVVPDSDPFAPPLDWVPLLPNRYSEHVQSVNAHSASTRRATTHLDDIVPDSDPPYPPWMEVLIPYEPRIESPPRATTEGGEENVEAVRNTTPRQRTVRMERRIEYVYFEEMVDTVETLFTMSPARYSYTNSLQQDAPCPSSHQDGVANRCSNDTSKSSLTATGLMEEPSSEDEREYRRLVEYEMHMDHLQYGSSSLESLPSPTQGGSTSLPAADRGPSPTSEDEREWMRQQTIPSPDTHATRGDPTIAVNNDEISADESEFEEAQRPPWFTGRREEAPVDEGSEDSSEDEVVSN
jgi:hypothetical protein